MTSISRAPPGHFTILYFASASSYTTKESENLKAPLALSSLFDVLEKNYPGMNQKILESCLVTVNLEYVDMPDREQGTTSDIMINAGDEVAIIPPVSSG